MPASGRQGFGGMKPITIDVFLLFTPNIPLFHYSIIPDLKR
jgi:hypothetical protein